VPEHTNTVSTDQLVELVQPSLRHLELDLVDLQWRPGRIGLPFSAPAGPQDQPPGQPRPEMPPHQEPD